MADNEENAEEVKEPEAAVPPAEGLVDEEDEPSTGLKRKAEDAPEVDEPPAKAAAHDQTDAEAAAANGESAAGTEADPTAASGADGAAAEAAAAPDAALATYGTPGLYTYSMPAAPGMPLIIDVAQGLIGKIIGKGGDTIRSLQANSGGHIDIDQHFPDGVPRKVTISGHPMAIDAARIMIEDLLKPVGHHGPAAPGSAERVIECPKALVGRVIGRGGETIKGLQNSSGARVQIDQAQDPCRVTLSGPPANVENCARMVADILGGGHTAPYQAAARGMPGGVPHAAAAMYPPQAMAAYPGAAAYPPQYGAYPGYPPQAYPGYPAAYPGYPPQAYAGYPPPAAGADPAAAAAAAAAAYGAYGAYQQPQQYAQQPPPPQQQPQQKWTAMDDGAGRTYYYNTETGVSQWEKPPGL